MMRRTALLASGCGVAVWLAACGGTTGTDPTNPLASREPAPSGTDSPNSGLEPATAGTDSPHSGFEPPGSSSANPAIDGGFDATVISVPQPVGSGTTGCSGLSACCAQLSGGVQTACETAVSEGNDTACTAYLDQLTGIGTCN